MKFNNKVKPGLASLLLTLIPTIILAFLLITMVASDSSGEPETGWVAVIAIFILGPPLFIFALLTLWRFIRYKQLNNSESAPSTYYQNDTPSNNNDPPATVG
jgi:hypothetical protein